MIYVYRRGHENVNASRITYIYFGYLPLGSPISDWSSNVCGPSSAHTSISYHDTCVTKIFLAQKYKIQL